MDIYIVLFLTLFDFLKNGVFKAIAIPSSMDFGTGSLILKFFFITFLCDDVFRKELLFLPLLLEGNDSSSFFMAKYSKINV